MKCAFLYIIIKSKIKFKKELYMTHNMKKLLFAATLVVSAANLMQADSSCSDSSSCCSGCMQSQNTFQPRAFSVNMAREIMLEKPAWEGMDDQEGWHGSFGVGFNYSQNFGENCNCEAVKGCCSSLGSVPFWSGNNEMSLGGNSGKSDFDVYQIGLGRQEAHTPVTAGASALAAQSGTVRLDPRIYQTGADFFLYAGAHKTERGFFVKLHGPVGVMSVDPRLSFAGDVTGRAYERGILNAADAPVAAPYENIEQAFAGDKEAGFLKKMKYGKIDCKRSSSATFGDLAMAVGYNVFADESKHLGVALRFSAPTGNKSDAEYVFDPIFGRNGHWAAGGEIIGHWRAWESDSSDNYLDLWMDGTAEHLFRSKHTRSFDLKANGAGSKYLLLARYENKATGAAFQNQIENAVNVTTTGIESTFGVEGNMALMADFHWGNWSAGLGYEIWGRSCEKLKLDCKCPSTANLNEYAVLGRQAPYSSVNGTSDAFLCEPKATIGKSEARVDAMDTTKGILNARAAANRIPSELSDALDIDAQRAHAAVTSKVFGQVAYTWKDSDYSPFMGLMGSGEFNHKDNSAIKFWSVGVHGGLAF